MTFISASPWVPRSIEKCGTRRFGTFSNDICFLLLAWQQPSEPPFQVQLDRTGRLSIPLLATPPQIPPPPLGAYLAFFRSPWRILFADDPPSHHETPGWPFILFFRNHIIGYLSLFAICRVVHTVDRKITSLFFDFVRASCVVFPFQLSRWSLVLLPWC